VTAKAGLAGMTRALALDLAPHGITVNLRRPGTIDTVRGCRARRSVPPTARNCRRSAGAARPRTLANAVRFLCGPGARYITGQALHISGGGYMG
jgi:3-oxoacyl-[acyl-carrier protein] reductase